MQSSLTKADVLLAMQRAIAPHTAYIHDSVCRQHGDRVESGEVPLHEFEMPTVALVLSRLKALRADGMVERSRDARGIYGYSWSFTDAGRSALAKEGK